MLVSTLQFSLKICFEIQLLFSSICKSVFSHLPFAILVAATENSMRYIICPKHSLTLISLLHGLKFTKDTGMGTQRKDKLHPASNMI